MDKIVITGIPPYDGEYPFEGNYTMRELHTIKRLANVRAGELMDALEAGDSDIVVAAALIALQRAGKNPDENDIWDAQMGAIQLVAGEEPDDPANPTTLERPDDPNGSSGGSSEPPAVTRVTDLSPTGSPLSATGAISDPETSAA